MGLSNENNYVFTYSKVKVHNGVHETYKLENINYMN
jgi:hypothetical protein